MKFRIRGSRQVHHAENEGGDSGEIRIIAGEFTLLGVLLVSLPVIVQRHPLFLLHQEFFLRCWPNHGIAPASKGKPVCQSNEPSPH